MLETLIVDMLLFLSFHILWTTPAKVSFKTCSYTSSQFFLCYNEPIISLAPLVRGMCIQHLHTASQLRDNPSWESTLREQMLVILLCLITKIPSICLLDFHFRTRIDALDLSLPYYKDSKYLLGELHFHQYATSRWSLFCRSHMQILCLGGVRGFWINRTLSHRWPPLSFS